MKKAIWWWSCICTRMVPATLLLWKMTSCHSLLKAPSWFQIEYDSFVRKTALDFLWGHLQYNIVHRILKSSSQNLMHLKSESSKSVIRHLDKSHLICQIEFRSLGESGNQLENFCMYSGIVPLGLTRPKWIKVMPPFKKWLTHLNLSNNYSLRYQISYALQHWVDRYWHVFKNMCFLSVIVYLRLEILLKKKTVLKIVAIIKFWSLKIRPHYFLCSIKE